MQARRIPSNSKEGGEEHEEHEEPHGEPHGEQEDEGETGKEKRNTKRKRKGRLDHLTDQETLLQQELLGKEYLNKLLVHEQGAEFVDIN